MDERNQHRSENFIDAGRGTPESLFGRNWTRRNPLDFLWPDTYSPRGFHPWDLDPYWAGPGGPIPLPELPPFDPRIPPTDPFLPQPRSQPVPLRQMNRPRRRS